MTQTTGGLSATNASLEISTNGSSWTDVAGFGVKVEPSEQTRQTGEVYTLDGDTAIITSGKLEPIELEITVVYTEGASEPFEVVRGQFQTAGGGALYARYSPKGGQSTEFMFTTPAGVVSKFNWPKPDAGTPDPQVIMFAIKVPYVTKSAVA
jgi:hypothetical protein